MPASSSLPPLLALAECFCGDTVPRGDGNADNCNKPCTGERWEVCGGHSRINIYEDEEEPTSLKDDSVEGAVALGCYKDDKDNRVLDEHKFDDKTGMTAQARGLRTRYRVYNRVLVADVCCCILGVLHLLRTA